MKIRCKRVIISLISVVGVISLTGCSSVTSSRMPKGAISMQQAYNQAINGQTGASSGGTLSQVRAEVQSLSVRKPEKHPDTRVSINSIKRQFPRLPNPSIALYVYPHDVGSGDNITPIPGYVTVFSMYTHVYYMMSDD